MKILITGATGLVGTALVPFLAARGHEIIALSRSGRPGTVRWNPARGEIDSSSLAGVSAVVHLAGANIAAGRWTAARKDEIRRSRVDGTRLLVSALGQWAEPPRVFVSASAVGYYGDTGEREVDESAAAGRGFLAEVCQAWEAEATKASDFGARVVHLRSGVVISRHGGPLAKMLPVFKAGMGGQLGSGQQWLSWIMIEDLLAVITDALESGISGPVNAVAPGVVTNAGFTSTLARVLGRPAIIPVPRLVLRLAFGAMAEETLLASNRVRAARLEESGFTFRYPHLEGALRRALDGD